MAKIKNKKRSLAEKVHGKDVKRGKKSTNPFEVHINREKMKVLGRKQKNDRGLPGVSRAKALKKRKNTLLQEYKVLNKANKFTDKRIGERNHSLTEEDRTMARFTAERLKVHKKKSIFNLADEEVLTHKGQTLSEIEKFDDIGSDDDDSFDGENSGKLDSNFVEEAHFGGGILKKTGKEGAMTHRELIDQLIAESKKRKAEKQQIKEATLELTEKLDTEWKDLLPLVSKAKKSDEPQEKQKTDDYDKVMRELKFEARGTPSDRLKTEDEIAKEEKERLEKLEQERLERMRGTVAGETKKPVHRSADDLDDDIVYESDPEYMLSYNEQGESNVEVNAEINGKPIQDEGNNSEQESEQDENDSEVGSEDSLSDLKNESSSDEDVEEQEDCSEKIKADLLERKAIMETARNELPFTFAIPESYEDFKKFLMNQSPTHQSVIIERMIKCNHPSLGQDNKENLGMVFVYVMQHLADECSEAVDDISIRNCLEVFRCLLPQIFDLAQLNQENAQSSVIEIIKEKHSEYRTKKKLYPGLDVLIFLKLISCLFPTSDFRHLIVTPCFVFMEQMLTKCRVLCRRDVAYGLFVVTLVLEWTVLSKRFLPAAINFLAGILHLAIPKTGVKLIRVLPPFKATLSLLSLTKEMREEVSLKLELTDLLNRPTDDSFKVRSLFVTLQLLNDFHKNLSHLPSLVEIYEPIFKYLNLIPKQNYPERVQKEFENLIEVLQNSVANRTLEYIVMEKKRPKALKLYEPKIEPVYDVKKHKVQSKAKAERDKLLYKIKKEKKGALREIRRDQAFLGRVKIKERIRR